MVENFMSAFIIDKLFLLSSQVQPKINELCINETDDFLQTIEISEFPFTDFGERI